MTKAALLAGTAVVWTLGFGAVAALSYEVTRPLSVSPVAVAQASAPLAERTPDAQQKDAPRVIVLPPAHVVAQRPQAAVIHARSPEAVKRHCSDWRPLQQGYASVQVCE